MKKKARLAIVIMACGVLFTGRVSAAKRNIEFDLRLYKAVPADGARVFVRWMTAKVKTEGPNVTYFYTGNVKGREERPEEAEIKRVFKIKELEAAAQGHHLIAYDKRSIRLQKSDGAISGWWDGYYGIKGPLLEASLSDGKKYDIRIIPIDDDVSPYRFKLQVHEPAERTVAEHVIGSVLPSVFYVDVEFALSTGETTIIGFADARDTPYFLAIRLERIYDGQEGAAQVGKLPQPPVGAVASGGVTGGIVKSGQPETVRTVAPEYPESCRSKGIEGSVGLEVSVDAQGKPTEVKVLKSAHPDLDKAAVAAVKQWLFKPVVVAGKSKAAVYELTVDFKMKEAGKSDPQSPAQVAGGRGA